MVLVGVTRKAPVEPESRLLMKVGLLPMRALMVRLNRQRLVFSRTMTRDWLSLGTNPRGEHCRVYQSVIDCSKS